MSPLFAPQLQQHSSLPQVDSRHPSDQQAQGNPKGVFEPDVACFAHAASEGVNSMNSVHQRPSWGSGYGSSTALTAAPSSSSTWGSGGVGQVLRYDSLGGTSGGSNGGSGDAATATPSGATWGSSCSSSHRPSVAGSSDGGGGAGGSSSFGGGSSSSFGRPPLPGGSRLGSASEGAAQMMSRPPFAAIAAVAVRRPFSVPALDLSLLHSAAEQRTRRKKMKTPQGGLSRELGEAEAPASPPPVTMAMLGQEGDSGTEYLVESAADLEVGGGAAPRVTECSIVLAGGA